MDPAVWMKFLHWIQALRVNVPCFFPSKSLPPRCFLLSEKGLLLQFLLDVHIHTGAQLHRTCSNDAVTKAAFLLIVHV